MTEHSRRKICTNKLLPSIILKIYLLTFVNSVQQHEGMRLNIHIVKIERIVRRFPKCHFLFSG